MNGETDNGGTIRLPEGLTAQLRALERRLWWAETLFAVLGGLAGLGLGLLLCVVSDRFWDTPRWLRAALTLGSVAALAGCVWSWGRRWIWRRRDARALARLVQKQYPRLGDRLLGAVELAAGRAPNLSPELCRAALRQVAQEAERCDFRQAVNVRRPRRMGALALLLAGLLVAVFVVAPDAAWNALRRWGRPLAPIERFTFVSLEAMPDELIVPHGESFELVCRLAPHSRWNPPDAVCRFERQPPVKARIEGGAATFRLPGQTRAGSLDIRIGDLTRRLRVTPLYRPELLRMEARVRLPDYLQRPGEQATPVEHGAAVFLRGSRVRLEGRVNRELRAATLAPASSGELRVDGPVFAGGALTEAGRLTFEWTDLHGLTNAAPYRLDVSFRDDAAPDISATGLAPAVAILPEESVTLTATARDDYGVRGVWVEWTVEAGADGGGAVTSNRTALAAGGPEAVETRGDFQFSPVQQDVAEESVVTLVACAADYLPGRAPSATAPFRILVLSRAKHAQLLQDQLRAAQARIEELARAEEQQVDRTTEQTLKNEAELARPEAAEALRDASAAERTQRRDAEEVARELARLAREALRNRDIAAETVAKWSELAAALQETAETPIQSAAQSLQQAAESPAGRRTESEQALEQEREALAKLRELEQQASQSAQRMQAQSFVNRLRQAARDQSSVAETLRTLLPKSLGLTPEQAPETVRGENERLTRRQGAIRRDAGYVRDDLNGFFQRTQEAVFGEVGKAMTQANLETELDRLAADLTDNRGGQASAAAGAWAARFDAWAQQLQDALSAGSGGGGGGGGGQPKKVDLELLMALMRARQQEEGFREQTRHLEEGRGGNPEYAPQTQRLGRAQGRLSDDVLALLERVQADPQAQQSINRIADLMDESAFEIKRPATGPATIAIQTEIVELLSQTMQQCGAQQAAGMMKGMQLGQKPGATPGGSTAGGDTDKTGSGSGAAGGAAGEGGSPTKGSGLASEWPEEYRDALRAYYEALEANP